MPVCWRLRAWTMARVGKCGGCSRISMRVLGCRKLDCRTCAGDVGRRRARAVVQRMGAAQRWHAIVFGLPRSVTDQAGVTVNPGWQAALTVPRVAKLRKAVGALLLAWSVAYRGGRSGWVVHTHPCGDRDVPAPVTGPKGRKTDSDEWGPHFHALGPCVVSPEQTRVPRACAGKVEPGALDALRRAWGTVLDRFADDHGLPVAVSVVHLRFIAKRGKMAFRATYDGRSFPTWAAGSCDSEDCPSKKPGGPEKCPCMSKLLRAVWIGAYAPNMKQPWAQDYRCMTELSEATDEDGVDTPGAMACPCCGGVIEWSPVAMLAKTLIRGPPDKRASIALAPRPARAGGPWLSWVPVGACSGAR